VTEAFIFLAVSITKGGPRCRCEDDRARGLDLHDGIFLDLELPQPGRRQVDRAPVLISELVRLGNIRLVNEGPVGEGYLDPVVVEGILYPLQHIRFYYIAVPRLRYPELHQQELGGIRELLHHHVGRWFVQDDGVLVEDGQDQLLGELPV